MKVKYDMKRFVKQLAILSLVFLPVIWLISWYCCDFEVGKAFIISALFAMFAVCVCTVAFGAQLRIYEEVENISKLMVDVVEGRTDSAAELYREGTIGILYTNFYKMVTVLQESRMKEGKEKEFLREIISDISHQLKTPLASLGVFVDLLYEDKLPQEEKRKEVLLEARKQLDRMEWMVLAMLKLARIEAGSIQFAKKPCNAGNIIGAAVEGVNYLTNKRGQRVVVELPKGHGPGKGTEIFCDGEWLTEALINLLKNASDYSGEGTEITITLEKNQLFTRIHVQDEGVGIPEEALPHIFKRFYRVNNTVNPGSVGIGLALTKSIVEGMGGKISVKSEVGRYTHFAITFL